MSGGQYRQMHKKLGGGQRGNLLNSNFTVDSDSVLLVFMSQSLAQYSAPSRNKQINIHVNRSGIHVLEHASTTSTGSVESDGSSEDSRFEEI